MKIDFVIPWVDGADPAWKKEKNEYMGCDEPDSGEDRYRDMGILKYWFRAVENYAPWVNQIHFVTWGHLPQWLNAEHPKLHIVNHKDYIPEEYLPTFSSHPIELNLHRIPGLSEHFVYFNDDTLLNGPVTPDFFFHKGKPCDFFQCKHVHYDIYAHVTTNNVVEVNRFHSYIGTFFKFPGKVFNLKYGLGNSLKNVLKLANIHRFAGFQNHHLPAAYCKKTWLVIWETMPELMHRVSQNRFRTPYDVSQSLFRYWQLASGQFHPVSSVSRGCFLSIAEQKDRLETVLKDLGIKMVCINDTPSSIDFVQTMEQIVTAYETKFPQKSSFEI